MNWTKTLPTNPGLYWIFRGDNVDFIEVLGDHPILSIDTRNDPLCSVDAFIEWFGDDVQWYGPLEKPAPPSSIGV